MDDADNGCLATIVIFVIMGIICVGLSYIPTSEHSKNGYTITVVDSVGGVKNYQTDKFFVSDGGLWNFVDKATNETVYASGNVTANKNPTKPEKESQ